jgi:hypothetical protein
MSNYHIELIYKPASQYEIVPPLHPFLRGVDVVLDPFMRKVSRGVLSHGYHWDKRPFDERFRNYAVPVVGNPDAPVHNKGPEGDFKYWAAGHLGGITKGYLLDVNITSLPRGFDLGDFFFAFSDFEMNYLIRSRIAMNKMFMFLTGPKDWNAFLMDRNGNPLPGKLLSPLISWDEKPLGTAIL